MHPEKHYVTEDLDFERLAQARDALLQALRSRWPSATIISTICRRRPTRSARSCFVSSGSGRGSGFVASAKGTITPASIGSVLAPLAERLPKVAHLSRIDHHDRQAGARQSRHDSLERAGRLDRDERRRKRVESGHQFFEARAIAGGRKNRPGWMGMPIQPILRNIDADIASAHPSPSLRNRASLRAPKRLFGSMEGGRKPRLIHGLGVPKGCRSPIRHRFQRYARFGGNELTRELLSKRD